MQSVYNSKWHTKTIHDSRHPQWKDAHLYTEKDFTPGQRLKFSVLDTEHLEKNGLLGVAILDSRQFYPDGFEGTCQLRSEGSPLGQNAHIKVKIVVDAEEAKLAAK